ncbi:hypothetical protein KCG44_03525 [Pacificimonas sp. WHA3]|uniref:Uncharacterized protein n=1 Tax=Pacificimonas pallii TaxID=2827236 RepID=A0ABS6SBQ7_9SPHN|nr:hypothetical protein [Pacificimonas pallii]MBV7255853.1 hypothetical protein [Pacificimonas pallii]
MADKSDKQTPKDIDTTKDKRSSPEERGTGDRGNGDRVFEGDRGNGDRHF